MTEKYVQDSFPGFFDDQVKESQAEVQKEYTVQVVEQEYIPEFSSTQDFYESPKGLRVQHNPYSRNYLALLEKNPLGDIVQKPGFLPILKEQIECVRAIGGNSLDYTKPIPTAGEFAEEGNSFIGLYRNGFRGGIPGGESEIFRANTECHLIQTSFDERGRKTIKVIKLSMPSYGAKEVDRMFFVTIGKQSKAKSNSELQKRIMEFEENPRSAKPGTLHTLFQELENL
ncbi:MAG TPA: hypothetical protein VJY47_03260 [Candidatus Dojkabacteria bacterium]|jgi:hypothetical protein|nr:hypothetical protein [Candidatus Dojkabacteria bacterium]